MQRRIHSKMHCGRCDAKACPPSWNEYFGRITNMIDVTRRRLLFTMLGVASANFLSTSRGISVAADSRPIIGAIRWDAWYDPDGNVGRVVEESLGPQEFHDRMPFFGREIDGNHVRIDGYSQTIFDQEIR